MVIKIYAFGSSSYILPVLGQWDGLGKTEIGVYKDGMWYLDYNGNGAFDPDDKIYAFGAPGWSPVLVNGTALARLRSGSTRMAYGTWITMATGIRSDG